MERLLQNRTSILLGLGIYFALHVCVRSFVSPSLGYDESEQAFLSQRIAWGYNSQPPLYTWIQALLFQILGCNTWALAIFKNLLLLLTYVFLFVALERATGKVRLAAVGSLGMFTIPQIAWESHRDLSHTVAATCMTCALFYCILRLADRKLTRPAVGYVLLGLVVAAGILFKYNFAIVVAGFIVAAASITEYRPLLFNRKMWLAVATAAILLMPHCLWLMDHAQIASGKTLQTLTIDRSDYWIGNLWLGSRALILSTICCCGLTVLVFSVFYLRKAPDTYDQGKQILPVRLLIERFLLVILAILLAMVLTGHAVEFKNRWLQPFVCLVPAYLVLRFGDHVLQRPKAQRVAMGMTLATMLFLLVAVIVRPVAANLRGKYCWLNMPYDKLALAIEQQWQSTPQIIMTPHMRLGGNLCVAMPNTTIISNDSETLLPTNPKKAIGLVVLVTDQESAQDRAQFAKRVAQEATVNDMTEPWIPVELALRYGTEGATTTYYYCRLLRLPQTHPNRIANVPENTNNKSSLEPTKGIQPPSTRR